jgi:hypothetical protein
MRLLPKETVDLEILLATQIQLQLKILFTMGAMDVEYVMKLLEKKAQK